MASKEGVVASAGELAREFSHYSDIALGRPVVVTKNGRAVARITPTEEFEREKAKRAADGLRALLAAQGPRVSEEEAQRNWEEVKRELDAEDDEQIDAWLSSSTRR